MLALPSLELTRARRHGIPLLSCRTTSLQVALASLQAAILEKQAIMLSIDATTTTTLPHEALLAALLTVGREAPVHVVIEVLTHPSREAVDWWLDRGVLALTLHGTKNQISRALSWAEDEAQAYGAEVGISLAEAVTQSELHSLSAKQVAFIHLNPPDSSEALKGFLRASNVPVLALAAGRTLKQSQSLVKAGAAGVTLSHELHEAFTAGVRTGLRSRTVTDPTRYLSYGATAVREMVRAHLTYFK